MSDHNSTSIAAAPDDARRRPAGARRRSGGKGGGAGGGRSLFVNLVLVVLVAGLGAAGWFIANQQRLLMAERANAAEANRRLHALEERLRMTDQVITESDAETGEQIDFWESEVRKLWAVANERNKGWIQDNQKRLTAQNASINGLQSSNKTLKSMVDRHEQALREQQDVIDQLTSVELQLQQLIRGQRDIVDRVNANSRTVATFGSQIKEHDQAIAAIDSYRRQTNNRLAQVDDRLAQADDHLAQVNGRLAQVDGRLAQVDDRLANLTPAYTAPSL